MRSGRDSPWPCFYHSIILSFHHFFLYLTDNFRTFAKKERTMKPSEKEKKSRFDTRLPEAQKRIFEKAARLGGYRSLTDFVILTVQEKALEIIREKEQVLGSDRDQEIFFNALMNPAAPNKELRSAAKKHRSFLKERE